MGRKRKYPKKYTRKKECLKCGQIIGKQFGARYNMKYRDGIRPEGLCWKCAQEWRFDRAGVIVPKYPLNDRRANEVFGKSDNQF